jgi:hypothetical protein
MAYEAFMHRLRPSAVRAAVFVAATLLVASSPIHAQRSSEFTIDARPFGASIGFAQRVTNGVYLGLAAGGGVDALDRTFAPDPAEQAYRSFEQIAHITAFLRQKPSTHFDVDLGLRLGIGGVRECTSSDCWPGAFVGLTAGAFWGSDRIKVGPRALWALARESGESNPVFYAEILTLRIRL